MPTETQTGALCIESEDFLDEELPTVVDVRHVSMVFNMASQQLNSLKEYAIALLRRELMFKEFRALNDISFEVKKGDVFGILGTNGSGKSTLLKIISGVLTPTEGSVEIQGKIAPLIELAAGFDMELTGRENIFLNGSLLGHSKKYIEQHFDAIVEFAEIEDFLDMPLKNYSSGMVSRIAFAIATVMIPDILIVDEVLSVGDFMFQEKCEARIQDLIHNHGVTVLIVSHSIDQIERLCNKAIWIEKSHPRLIGEAHDVARVYRVLGGHKGAAESEKLVLDTLLSKVPYKDVKQRVMAGASRYDTSVEILERCTFDDTSRVIVSNSDHTLDRIIALGLAGAMGVPAVAVRDSEIPESVAKALRRMKPAEIIVVDSGGSLDAGALDELEDVYEEEAPPQITEIGGADPAALSQAAAAYAAEQGIAITRRKATRQQEFDLVIQAPVFYKHGIVIDLEEPDHGGADGDGAEVDSYFSYGQEESAGKDRYGALSDFENELGNLLWTQSDSRESGNAEFVFVTSHNPADSLAAAMYVAQREANMALLNHRNLNNFAGTIKLIKAYPRDIGRLTFIGDEYCFNQVDKEILAKATKKQ